MSHMHKCYFLDLMRGLCLGILYELMLVSIFDGRTRSSYNSGLVCINVLLMPMLALCLNARLILVSACMTKCCFLLSVGTIAEVILLAELSCAVKK